MLIINSKVSEIRINISDNRKDYQFVQNRIRNRN